MKPLQYWDSDIFLAYLLGETVDERDKRCKHGIEEAESGASLIVTSSLTLTEVIHLKDLKPLTRSNEQAIENLFLHPWIVVRVLDRHIATQARELIWDAGVKPKDSIHIATALAHNVDVMYTFDKQLIGFSNKFGSSPLTICVPPLPAALRLDGM
jgi:predicted nucleic acid-binding protein